MTSTLSPLSNMRPPHAHTGFGHLKGYMVNSLLAGLASERGFGSMKENNSGAASASSVATHMARPGLGLERRLV